MFMKQKQEHAIYQISLKVLFRDGEKVLITIGDKKDIDLPGGRIDAVEINAPLEDVIAREIREELGEDVKFRLGKVLFVNRSFGEVAGLWVFHIVFDAVYLSGDIKLSPEHISYEWVEGKTYQVKRDAFLKKDEEKYERFREYFESLTRN